LKNDSLTNDSLMNGVLLLVITALLATAAFAQGGNPANFSGVWVLNKEKSDFGPLPAPDSATYTIRHDGANLALDADQDGTKKHLEFITDGQEHVTESDQDSEIVTRVYWSGSKLVFDARRRPRPAHQTNPVSWTSKWSLSENRKVLTIDRQIATPEGPINQMAVFDKR
jgi:hypothetical protein